MPFAQLHRRSIACSRNCLIRSIALRAFASSLNCTSRFCSVAQLPFALLPQSLNCLRSFASSLNCSSLKFALLPFAQLQFALLPFALYPGYRIVQAPLTILLRRGQSETTTQPIRGAKWEFEALKRFKTFFVAPACTK